MVWKWLILYIDSDSISFLLIWFHFLIHRLSETESLLFWMFIDSEWLSLFLSEPMPIIHGFIEWVSISLILLRSNHWIPGIKSLHRLTASTVNRKRPWKLYRVISGHLGWVQCAAVDWSNEWFCTGSADRTIKIWSLHSGALKLTLTGHISAVRALAVSPTHSYLFSCAEDKKVCCWDLETNRVIRHYHGHLSGNKMHLFLSLSLSLFYSVSWWKGTGSELLCCYLVFEVVLLKQKCCCFSELPCFEVLAAW